MIQRACQVTLQRYCAVQCIIIVTRHVRVIPLPHPPCLQVAKACGASSPHLYKVLRVLAQHEMLYELPGKTFKPNDVTRELVQVRWGGGRAVAAGPSRHNAAPASGAYNDLGPAI